MKAIIKNARIGGTVIVGDGEEATVENSSFHALRYSRRAAWFKPWTWRIHGEYQIPADPMRYEGATS